VLHNLNPRTGAALAPGTVVQIQGENLASSTTIAGLPLPTEVEGTSVLIGGYEAPLYYVSPTQINAQLPFELEATKQYPVIVVANGAIATPDSVRMAPVQPGVAAFPDGRIIAQHADDFRLVTPEAPARPGETIVVYLAGMGRTDQIVATGEPSPAGEPLARVRAPASATLDGEPVRILYAGLTPGGVGLYQINWVVPESARSGELRLAITQNGEEANAATVPVQSAP
jgi:adhesin/invasin